MTTDAATLLQQQADEYGVAPDKLRTLRFSGFPYHDALLDTPVTVIGVGGIGRWLAIALATAGVKHLTIVDFDEVDAINQGTQGYLPSDIGKPKVSALSDTLTAINPDINVCSIVARFQPSDLLQPVRESAIFTCVDSMAARSSIWASLSRDRPAYYLDGRMAASIIRIVSWSPSQPPADYTSTLHSDNDSHQAESCTTKATLHTGMLAAGHLLNTYTRMLVDHPFRNPDVLHDLNCDMTKILK
jgi:hypothetical protein